MQFKLKASYKPAGDQPEAIEKLTQGLGRGFRHQTLLGVTGSGKTFTMASVIQNIQKPTLVIAHNKTLAAQLCNEFREFFPDNAVEYFVSYYDYYQPEAYIPRTDTFIEKEAMINEEIDRLRHAATQAVLTRKDCIIVASVSCIYGLGAPETYQKTLLHLSKGQVITRGDIIRRLLSMQFERKTGTDLVRGSFRVRGDILEIMPMNQETIYRVTLDAQTITEVEELDPITRKHVRTTGDFWLFPAKHFITSGPERETAIKAIRSELKERLAYFEKKKMYLESERLERRCKEDLAMIREVGYCSGIENYSRHLSGRGPGEPPDTLLSYFPDDFLTVIDESHVTIPQVGGMYAGDQSRKKTLIEHGFRLPSAADNRPLKFDEFMERVHQLVYVSATPGDYELQDSEQVVEQIIRPTGLIDPELIVRPITSPVILTPDSRSTSLRTGASGRVSRGKDLKDSSAEFTLERSEGPQNDGLSQVEDFIIRAREHIAMGDRALATTLTKKMAEDLTEYLTEQKLKVKYLHSDVKTLERIEIISAFRRGEFDIIVGVNLLREGLDLPEVSLVAVFDADKEGFLRSETSLIQTIGRAARNLRGRVVLYADVVTGSMKRAIQETERRRAKQLAYNAEHGITPKSVERKVADIMGMLRMEESAKKNLKLELAAEPHALDRIIKEKEAEMKKAAKGLQFELAALLRDELAALAKELRQREAAPTPRVKVPKSDVNPFLKRRSGERKRS